MDEWVGIRYWNTFKCSLQYVGLCGYSPDSCIILLTLLYVRNISEQNVGTPELSFHRKTCLLSPRQARSPSAQNSHTWICPLPPKWFLSPRLFLALLSHQAPKLGVVRAFSVSPVGPKIYLRVTSCPPVLPKTESSRAGVHSVLKSGKSQTN